MPRQHSENTSSVEKRSFCRLCGSFCAFIATVEGNRITSIKPDRDDPVSKGYMCPKGIALKNLHHHPKRLNEPQIKYNDNLLTTDWETTLDDIAGKLRRIINEQGPQAIGAYGGTPAVPCSSINVWRMFMAALNSPQIYSTVSIDVACAPLVSERVTGNPMLVTQPDAHAKMTVLIGINPMVSHGHNYFMSSPRTQLRRWAEQGELWVLDPRRSESAEFATHYLAPWPGSEFMLLGHALRELLRDGANWDFLDQYVTGIDKLREVVERFTLEETSAGTRLSEQEVTGFVQAIRKSGKVAIICGTGISMGKNANVTWFLKWALLGVTGSLDRKGGAYINPGFARSFEKTGWMATNTTGPGPASRPDLPSRLGEYPCVAIADEIEAGNLRALFIVAGNPVIALPDTDRLYKAFEKLELLVVIDVVETATTSLATHLLPGTGQLEMSDITLWDFLNPVEYARYGERVVEPVAERKPLWWIMQELATRLDIDLGLPADTTHDDDVIRPMMANARASFDEVRASSTVMIDDCTYEWVHQHLPGGRWNLAPDDLLGQLVEAKVGQEKLVLTPHRQRFKVNGLMSDGLANPRRPDRPELLLNPDDATEFGITDDDEVAISTDTGTVIASARLNSRYRRGVVSLPHGFSDTNVNMLTDVKDIDPLSGMPTLAAFPVTISKTLARTRKTQAEVKP